MTKTARGCASILSIAVGTFFSRPTIAQQVPDRLQPPANETLLLPVHAKGDQIYVCESEASQQSQPSFYRLKVGRCTRSVFGTVSTGCPALRHAARPPTMTNA